MPKLHSASSSEGYDFAPEQRSQRVILPTHHSPWRLLIVDDDPEVHAISTLILRDFEFDGARLEILSAYTGAEGKRLLEETADVAVVLLDVVMETDRAGLDVVRYIREVLHNKFVRIILRTGQPGEAPERSVVFNYDINDYKEKTELTSDKLATTVYSALRAYRDMMLIENSRRGLEQVIASSRKLFEVRSLSQFCTGILHQLTTLLHIGSDALYANTSGFAAGRKEPGDIAQFTILAGTGSYANMVGNRISALGQEDVVSMIQGVIDRRDTFIDEGVFAAYFPTSGGSENIVFTQSRKQLTKLDRDLLGIFATNLGVAFDNLYLNREIAETQIELIYTLGEIVESRCNGTGHHVRRIAEFSRILARSIGLSGHDIELLQIAVPLHDIGKIGIPDSILCKKTDLSDEEMELMQTHTVVGHQILNNSLRPMLRSASLIALQHHEWWNGKGYPYGIAGEDINIFSRIVAIADVLDALISGQEYRESWSLDEAIGYIVTKRGAQFDPGLVDLLVANRLEFQSVVDSFPEIHARTEDEQHCE